ncbi:hypothetical protein [Glycomyces dulcitolivorans]|uniref:hypothetical protein n=1 Tax=Glycomyces dulcitolivorans TaxID=2200759 RepID=UPI0013007544|nr:hypothetical protein [Glycomyces dulcitolivorans]
MTHPRKWPQRIARWVMIAFAVLIGLLILACTLRLTLPEEWFWEDYGACKISPEGKDPGDGREILC